MPSVSLPIATLNRFLTRDLTIEPDLVGATHEFEYSACRIRIELPTKKHVPLEPGQGERLTFNGYRMVDDRKVPLWFWVSDVDIVVFSSEEVSIPEEVLDMHPNAYEIIPEAKRRQLDELAKRYRALAEKAFNLWIRTLRWKCDNSAIGRPTIEGYASGWSTYLINPVNQKGFWIQHDPFAVPGSKPITAKVWSNAEETLRNGLEPPVFIDLMFDGIEHLKLNDFRRATIDFAVSCESFLRGLVAASLPFSLGNSIREFLDEANIRPVMNKFVPEILNEQEQKQLKQIENTLNKLFDKRNKIVHKGQQEGLLPEECQKYLEVTRKLLSMKYHEIKG